MENKYAFHLLEQLVIKTGQQRHQEALQTLKSAVLAQQTNNKPICHSTQHQQAKISALLERAFDIAFTLPHNAELLSVIREARKLLL